MSLASSSSDKEGKESRRTAGPPRLAPPADGAPEAAASAVTKAATRSLTAPYCGTCSMGAGEEAAEAAAEEEEEPFSVIFR